MAYEIGKTTKTGSMVVYINKNIFRISEYNFVIQPKAGKLNVTADALSRLP